MNYSFEDVLDVIKVINDKILADDELISTTGSEEEVKNELVEAIDQVLFEEDKEFFNEHQTDVLIAINPNVKNIFGGPQKKMNEVTKPAKTAKESVEKESPADDPETEDVFEADDAEETTEEPAVEVTEAEPADDTHDEKDADEKPLVEKYEEMNEILDETNEQVEPNPFEGKTNRNDLLAALTVLTAGLSTGKNLPTEQADCFVFQNDRIMSFNDKTAASVPFRTGITGAIKGKEFLKLLKKIKDDYLSMEQVDGVVKIHGRTNVQIATAEPSFVAGSVNYPDFKSGKWMPLPNNFSDAAMTCMKIASKRREDIKSTCFSGQYAVAFDNYRAIKYHLDMEIENGFTLHNSVIKKVAEAGPSYYYVDKGWNHFMNQDMAVISTRIIDYAYYDQIIGLFDGKADIYFSFPENVIDTIDRVGTMAISETGPSDRVVTVKFSKGNMNCSTTSKLATVSEDVETEYDGEDFEFTAGPEEITYALKHTSEAAIGRCLKFNTDSFEYIVVLMG